MILMIMIFDIILMINSSIKYYYNDYDNDYDYDCDYYYTFFKL